MVLEGARQLDVARTTLQANGCETKIKKELKKAAKKAPAEEIRELAGRLSEAEREKVIAQLEVVTGSGARGRQAHLDQGGSRCLRLHRLCTKV